MKALDDCLYRDLPDPSRFIRVGWAGYRKLILVMVKHWFEPKIRDNDVIILTRRLQVDIDLIDQNRVKLIVYK